REGSGTLSTLARGLRALELIADSPRPLSAAEFSDALDIRPGAGYQILRTLRAEGWVVRQPDSSYTLGPTAIRIGARAGNASAPPPEALEVLESIHEALDENLYLTLKQGSRIAIAAHLAGERAVRVGPLSIGYAEHVHARATTRCVLAYLPEAEARAILPDELEALTAHTITDREAIIAGFAKIRERGYATEMEEFSEGVACVSSIVLDADGAAVGSIGISVPLERFRTMHSALVHWAHMGGDRISRALGYPGEYPPPA
ncbi:MAG: IclR family transcriptional regulator, partial [Microbacterium sp.]